MPSSRQVYSVRIVKAFETDSIAVAAGSNHPTLSISHYKLSLNSYQSSSI